MWTVINSSLSSFHKLIFGVILLEQALAELEYHEDTEENFIARYKRNIEKDFFPPNFRQPRFLDFYSCVSSSGTLGFCLPQPYCSYMVDGGILDPSPTKGCSHTMLSDYGCCTLPCGAANSVPLRSAAVAAPAPPVPSQSPPQLSPQLPPPRAPLVTPPPLIMTTTTTTTTTTMQNMPPLFSPPITSSPIDFPTCGKPNPNFQDVIRKTPADSQLAPTGRWCWQVAVMDSNLTFKCGGTLLNSRHVLTVAHCVQKSAPSSLLIRLGDTNLRSSDDNEDLSDVKVSRILIHPGYTGQSPFQNNLAILTLDTEAPINRNRICSVCLPAPGVTTEFENLFAKGSSNGRCITSGYGKLETRDEFPLMRMKEVPVPLITTEQCSNTLQGLLGGKFSLPDTFLCAGGEGLSDGCEYDGGGPLVCPVNNGGSSTFVLAGVVTWGIDCAKMGVPGVYTRVSNYTNWLRDNISVV